MVGGLVGRRKTRLRPTNLLLHPPERVVRPIEYYNWAVGLAGNAATEAEQRTVVSRLYYGLHHEACCRYYRVNPAAALKRRNRHACLAITFNSASDATSKNIANLLKDLRDLRAQADYELVPPDVLSRHPDELANAGGDCDGAWGATVGRIRAIFARRRRRRMPLFGSVTDLGPALS